MRPEQCRAARKLLGWSLLTAASRSKVYPDNIFLYEKREQSLPPENVTALRRAYETAGVVFEGDKGVSLAPPECTEEMTPEHSPTAPSGPGSPWEEPDEQPESATGADIMEMPAEMPAMPDSDTLDPETLAPETLDSAVVPTHTPAEAFDEDRDPIEARVSEGPPSPKKKEPKSTSPKTKAAKGRSSRPRKGNPKEK